MTLSAILVLYLNEKLGYNEDDASAIYHAFTMLVFFFCIPGGIIADVWLGKFKTILCFSIVYVFGCAAVLSSAFPNIGISQSRPNYWTAFDCCRQWWH